MPRVSAQFVFALPPMRRTLVPTRLTFVEGTLMKLRYACLAAALAAAATAAQADGNQMYIRGGSMGVGLGYSTMVTERIAARVGANYFNYSRDDTYESNRYSADLKFSSIEALADVYVAGGFRISGGAIYSANKLDLTAQLGAGGTFTMNGVTYSGINAASAQVDLGRKKVAPYIGIGYSSRPNEGKGLGFHFDVGIVHQNPQASITIDADPVVTGDPTFQANKAQEEAKLRDSVSSASNWPVLMFGMSYTF